MRMVERKWHIVYTRPGKERKVAGILASKKITHYLPFYNSECIVDGRKKILSGPLFPRYVFVLLDENKDVLNQSRHILNFVYWHDSPVLVQHEEINAMKLFLNEYACTRLDKAIVMPDAHYKINNELQLHKKGHVIEANIGTVKLTLPSLGQVLVAEIRKDMVEEFTFTSNSMLRSIAGS